MDVYADDNLIMMRLFLLIIFIICGTLVFGQGNKEYLIVYEDTTSEQNLIGYKNRSGEIIIKPQFTTVYTDTMYVMAIVIKDGNLVGIDRNEKILLKPFIYDNGPDYVEEGLFRFVEKNKIGFSDLNGRKIIKAKYDFAEPFHNGLSAYTLGGYKQFDKSGEHWWWVGGYESGFINKKGQEFSKVTELKNNQREAWTKKGKYYLLNEEGYIIKNLKQ